MKKLAFLTFLPTLLFGAEAEVSPARQGGAYQFLIMIGLALVFFYFLIIRPEKKRRKAMQEQREAIKKGDRVTAMGIIGTVDKVEKDTVILKMHDGNKIEFIKAAITDVESSSKSPEGAKKA